MSLAPLDRADWPEKYGRREERCSLCNERTGEGYRDTVSDGRCLVCAREQEIATDAEIGKQAEKEARLARSLRDLARNIADLTDSGMDGTEIAARLLADLESGAELRGRRLYRAELRAQERAEVLR